MKHFRLQDKIQDALMQIQSLETEINHMQREKHEILSDWEKTKVERKHLQTLLETALEEKRLMTDRINQFAVIGKVNCRLNDSHQKYFIY